MAVVRDRFPVFVAPFYRNERRFRLRTMAILGAGVLILAAIFVRNSWLRRTPPVWLQETKADDALFSVRAAAHWRAIATQNIGAFLLAYDEAAVVFIEREGSPSETLADSAVLGERLRGLFSSARQAAVVLEEQTTRGDSATALVRLTFRNGGGEEWRDAIRFGQNGRIVSETIQIATIAPPKPASTSGGGTAPVLP